ncbi:putative F420-dependent oxidoreductase, Rv2161c family [Mycobacterium parascrofulaceum ATCC BAA-614]|uniref:Putative F420-dependent oxidoreductase, Rv2161c family n=1 Tax=Mycobacterium parascrofulaceum ATCC BAA-614 TaxID=525368 RepID=D5PDV1_9MYCO|nr:putative F420-dependent oxidoreductase, Rv2161c family [Mycobacterium parascrofulaceum ATCC BAA-614]
MRLGLHALGIGAGADRAVIDAVASTADECGFATLWAGEHVVMVDRSGSRYPYSDDGVIAVPAQADWLDPTIALSFAAAASSRIGLATGVLLLPEHNPVVMAKQAASLDRLSGGRLTLGVGIGWSREEFAALSVPFARRGARTAEYVAAMRALWRDDVASFAGDFVRFDSIRVNPKPVRDRGIPIVVGGNSDRRCGGWRPGATVGTGSTSTGRRPRATGSPSWSSYAPSRGAIAGSCGCRWRCAIPVSAISPPSPSWASTNWFWSSRPRTGPRRRPNGSRRWLGGG